MLKNQIVSGVILLAGLLCHALGYAFEDADQSFWANTAGGFFDAVAAIVFYFKAKAAAADKYDDHYDTDGYVSLLLLALLPVALLSGGCATDPQMKVMQLRETYTVGVDLVNTSYEAGLIKPDDYLEIVDVCDGVDAALDVAEIAADAYVRLKALAGTDPSDVEAARERHTVTLNAVRDSVRRIIQMRVDAERAKSNERNTPTGGAAGGTGPDRDVSAGEPPADGSGEAPREAAAE